MNDAATAEVLRLIGDAACTADADCRTLAVGHKACGGPRGYLAWSLRRTDARALDAALARAAAGPGSAAGKPALASTCVFVADPGAHCRATAAAAPGGAARRCRLRDGADGAADDRR